MDSLVDQAYSKGLADGILDERAKWKARWGEMLAEAIIEQWAFTREEVRELLHKVAEAAWLEGYDAPDGGYPEHYKITCHAIADRLLAERKP